MPKLSGKHIAGSIESFLVKNTAYRQIGNNDIELTTDDEVVIVHDENNPSSQSIDHILCGSEQSRDFLLSCKEVVSGWPNSFAHADSDYVAKLATCYLIQFPSYMCYAVTALRVLTHAPWTENMFHGHLRELVLCAIGNGWTWADQTATVQKRRVSAAEVCAAFASYMNLKAFPPGQVSDLDTAIIAVCDDLFPDHCEKFFAQFKVCCVSCESSGQVSVPLFDTMLCLRSDNNEIDIAQMILNRQPRLALDREDVGFSPAADCANHEQLVYDETAACLIFTLKITSPIDQLPPATDVINLLGKSFNLPSISSKPLSQDFVLAGIIVAQGAPPNHFLVFERCHNDRIFLYDNLQGHKWVSIKQLRADSFVWGFTFRRQDQQFDNHTSFNPNNTKPLHLVCLMSTNSITDPSRPSRDKKMLLESRRKSTSSPTQPKKTLRKKLSHLFPLLSNDKRNELTRKPN